MGVWGTGLYAGDYAEDLKPTVRTLAKLPFTGDEIVDLSACSRTSR